MTTINNTKHFEGFTIKAGTELKQVSAIEKNILNSKGEVCKGFWFEIDNNHLILLSKKEFTTTK